MKEERERQRRGELQRKKEQEQDDIIKLKAKKRSLEMELEAVVSPPSQVCISSGWYAQVPDLCRRFPGQQASPDLGSPPGFPEQEEVSQDRAGSDQPEDRNTAAGLQQAAEGAGGRCLSSCVATATSSPP